ncbi:hypothetical protein Y032_0100g3255 [Ancylostoma ceylanicum]|uniref:Uncharacterized protein n=1 Tax=Ancylostoma ceylanicum TaxID=53326 RepID=A0A016TI82_9BILA|nr:hypothetical protein Y032_0100g3255 [Ancylostoma ceylanicum]
MPELQCILLFPCFGLGPRPGHIFSSSSWVKVPPLGTIESDGGLRHVSRHRMYGYSAFQTNVCNIVRHIPQ